MHSFKVLTCPCRIMAHNRTKRNRPDSLYHGFILAKTRNFTDFSTNLAIQHQPAPFSTSNHRKRVPRTTVTRWEWSIQCRESCFVKNRDSISNPWVHIGILIMACSTDFCIETPIKSSSMLCPNCLVWCMIRVTVPWTVCPGQSPAYSHHRRVQHPR